MALSDLPPKPPDTPDLLCSRYTLSVHLFVHLLPEILRSNRLSSPTRLSGITSTFLARDMVWLLNSHPLSSFAYHDQLTGDMVPTNLTSVVGCFSEDVFRRMAVTTVDSDPDDSSMTWAAWPIMPIRAFKVTCQLDSISIFRHCRDGPIDASELRLHFAVKLS
ncbi:unnamed protein product [Microthlaspi erraticum]|uniref:Uncharacterized protein n=1 Tax=Microthlaspi erraticum TaxID=1685480 RepID=A0A6D2II34_9BRAS|nr:unnamed protein product [Microthlaspi erraticum]